MSVKGNGHNIYAVASFLVVCHDIVCPCSDAATDDIGGLKIWRTKKDFHVGELMSLRYLPTNVSGDNSSSANRRLFEQRLAYSSSLTDSICEMVSAILCVSNGLKRKPFVPS